MPITKARFPNVVRCVTVFNTLLKIASSLTSGFATASHFMSFLYIHNKTTPSRYDAGIVGTKSAPPDRDTLSPVPVRVNRSDDDDHDSVPGTPATVPVKDFKDEFRKLLGVWVHVTATEPLAGMILPGKLRVKGTPPKRAALWKDDSPGCP